MFIVADINRRALMKRLSQLQYRQLDLSNRKQTILSEMNIVKSGDTLVNNKIAQLNNLKNNPNAQKEFLEANKDFFNQNTEGFTSLSNKLEDMISSNSNTNNAKQALTLQNVDSLKDEYYLGLQAKDTALDQEMESLDSQIQLVQKQVESQASLVQNNITQDSTLWCLGG